MLSKEQASRYISTYVARHLSPAHLSFGTSTTPHSRPWQLCVTTKSLERRSSAGVGWPQLALKNLEVDRSTYTPNFLEQNISLPNLRTHQQFSPSQLHLERQSAGRTERAVRSSTVLD